MTYLYLQVDENLRFIGMAGYYRHFCQNFSDVAAPLPDLVSTKTPFVSDRQEAFRKIKRILMSYLVLKSLDSNKPFVQQVDASDHDSGVVLLQES